MRGPDDEEDDDLDVEDQSGGPDEDDDDYIDDRPDVEDSLDEMKRNHPGYSEESYRAGKFLGVDFPYVPGDPFW